MSLNLLIYHPVKLPVTHYGGTERVLAWLAEALSKKGHKVTVFAARGSTLPEPLHVITDPEHLLNRIREFDVVHSFTKLPDHWDSVTGGRLMFTIHGNGQLGERFHKNTVFLSRNHALRHGAQAFVYNGLNPDELDFSDSNRPDRFLFLSKTSLKTKNLRGAMFLAGKYGQNLWIAGGERPIRSRLSVFGKRLLGKDWRWIGSVDQKQKAEFLRNGKALMFPLLWNEPFGLVVVESLMSGTPVLANPHGAMPEILSFAPACLMNSEADWGRALTGDLELPSPRACRDWAVSMFHMDKMAENYLYLYERVVMGESLNPVEPETRVLAGDLEGAC
jgi:glycosyltransferase involved in cell wall biosynthesis